MDVHPRLFEIFITLTFRAGYLKRVIDTAVVMDVYPRLFEISISLTFRAGYLKRVIGTATVYSRLSDCMDTWLP